MNGSGQACDPVDAGSPAEYQVRGYRRNMVVNILDMAFFMCAANVVSATIVLPAFMLRLGASAMLVALLPAVQILGWRLPQIVVPFLVEHRSRQMPWITAMGVLQRVPWLIIAAVTLLFAEQHPGRVLVVFMACILAIQVSSGFSYPAWGDFIAKVIPERHNGLFMGLNMMLGGALGVLGGFIVVAVLQRGWLPFPANYASLFLVASLLFWISFGFFRMTREPLHDRVAAAAPDFRSYLRALGGYLRHDANLRHFLVYQALLHSSVMGIGLFMAYTVRTFHVPDAVAGRFVVMSTVASMAASPLLGLLGDRAGHRWVLACANVTYALAAVVATWAHNWEVMYAVFILSAVSLTAQIIGFRNCIYEFAPEGRRPSYLALSGTIPAPFALLFSMLAGWLGDRAEWGYTAAFAVSTLFTCVGLAFVVFGMRPVVSGVVEKTPAKGSCA